MVTSSTKNRHTLHTNTGNRIIIHQTGIIPLGLKKGNVRCKSNEEGTNDSQQSQPRGQETIRGVFHSLPQTKELLHEVVKNIK